MPSGTLHWPARDLLCVSDLHFGKAQRFVVHGGSALPPYETQDTLLRLDQDIAATAASTVICLGDSFDRIGARDDLSEDERAWITRLQAARRWIWIEGNHDPGPVGIGGEHMAEFTTGPLSFRHIATEQTGEISGHYHPKVTLNLKARRVSRKCLLLDKHRIIMPAFGTYTGGLNVQNAPLDTLICDPAICVLLDGKSAQPAPRPRR